MGRAVVCRRGSFESGIAGDVGRTVGEHPGCGLILRRGFWSEEEGG